MHTKTLGIGIALTLGLALGPSACSVTKQAEVCVQANDGQQVTVVGYVNVAPFTLVSGNDFRIEVVESMSERDGIGAYVKVGTGPNTMKALPGEFSASDVELTLADGSTEGYGDRVAFTGRLSVHGDSCNIYDVETLGAP
ncbi:MAG: hypothetical protein KDK70_34305 [Myxococcales bacterium]|nr:hypothetical protein [Myxococcales bacterium]